MSLGQILLAEQFDSYVENGEIDLYHYSRVDQPTLTLQPDRFGENPYSQREMRIADYPRVFFYLDPNDKEKFFTSSAYNLYITRVQANTIYNLRKDPNKYIKEAREKNQGALSFNMLLEMIHNNNYKGVYYKPRRDMIAYFEPIVVTQIETD